MAEMNDQVEGESKDTFQPMEILGGTGLKRFGGYVYEEWHPKLGGIRAVRTFREMADNDPVIGAVVYVTKSLLRQVDWEVKAAGEEDENVTPEAEEAAKLLEECLGDMSHTWEDLLSEVLSMVVYGWSYFEVVYKYRGGPDQQDPTQRSKYADGKIGWRKIQLRAQETLDKWEFDDDGGIKGMWQLAPPDYKRVFLPIEKCVLFRTEATKNNPEGRSLLRNAYRPWYMVKRIQEIEATGVERDLVGLPVMQVPPEIMHPNATSQQRTIRAALELLVQRVRRDEYEGLLVPCEEDSQGRKTGYKFALLNSGGKRAIDTDVIIKRYETRIAMTLLAEFIMLGMDKVGALSLGDSKTAMFGVALGSLLDTIEETLNRFAVSRLMELNGVPVELHPKLSHGDVEAPDIDILAKYLQAMTSAGIITPDDKLEAHARKVAALPPKDLTTMEIPMVPSGEVDPLTGAPIMVEDPNAVAQRDAALASEGGPPGAGGKPPKAPGAAPAGGPAAAAPVAGGKPGVQPGAAAAPAGNGGAAAAPGAKPGAPGAPAPAGKPAAGAGPQAPGVPKPGAPKPAAPAAGGVEPEEEQEGSESSQQTAEPSEAPDPEATKSAMEYLVAQGYKVVAPQAAPAPTKKWWQRR